MRERDDQRAAEEGQQPEAVTARLEETVPAPSRWQVEDLEPALVPQAPWVRAGARAFLDIDRSDVIWVAVLIAVAFLLRAASPIFPDALSRLGGSPVSAWGLSYPATQSSCVDDVPVGPGGAPSRQCGFVFDEVYFPVDAAKDLHSPAVDYFDPEPPLGKLLMAPPIAALGFGDRWSWRLSVTIAGSLLVGLVYLVARRLRRERFFAVAAATFVCFDGLALVESRTGVIDVIAIFFSVLFFYAFLLHWQARTRRQWRATLYLMALVAGLAFGAKFTALAPLVVGAALVTVRLLEPHIAVLRSVAGPREHEAVLWRQAAGRRVLLHYGAAGLLAAAVFTATYSRYLSISHDTVYHFVSCSTAPVESIDPIHNQIVDHQQLPLVRTSGPHLSEPVDANGNRTLVRHDDGSVATIGGHAVPNPLTAIANVEGQVSASLAYHRNECRDHPYGSRWYTWPVMSHPVLFYADYTSSKTGGGSDEVGWVTDMGNPAVWWAAIPALLFCAWRMTRGPLAWRFGVCALGAVSFLAMVLAFHRAERPNPTATTLAPVHPGALFLLGFAGVVLFSVAAAISAVVSRRFVPGVIVLGFLAAWMMWVPGNEDRVLFFYHMLGALPFAALGLAYALSALRRVRIPLTPSGRTLSLAPAAYATLGVVLAAFVFFYPMWTGAPLTTADHAMRIWLGGW